LFLQFKPILNYAWIELNPIEGLWCFQKVNIRKNTDGTFEKLVELIDKTKEMLQVF
jgi:hypothetical protein